MMFFKLILILFRQNKIITLQRGLKTVFINHVVVFVATNYTNFH